MNRSVLLTAGFCAGLGLAAARVEATRVQSPNSAGSARLTLIGCVQRSEPATADQVGTTTVREGETKYVLANITLAGDNARTATPDAAATANAAAESVNMYRLDDAADSLIAPHVGDRVEVTATVVKSPASPTGTSGTLERSAPVRPTAPLLHVESIRKISSDSATCAR